MSPQLLSRVVAECMTLLAAAAAVQVIAAFKPVENNKEGSYLTMWSLNGLVFGIINVIGNFGTVFVDQSYWQGAIGAKPSATYKGYLLGGLCWFAVPFTMATSMGLAARAMVSAFAVLVTCCVYSIWLVLVVRLLCNRQNSPGVVRALGLCAVHCAVLCCVVLCAVFLEHWICAQWIVLCCAVFLEHWTCALSAEGWHVPLSSATSVPA